MKSLIKAPLFLLALVMSLAPLVVSAQPSGTLITPGGAAPTNQNQVPFYQRTGTYGDSVFSGSPQTGITRTTGSGSCGSIATGGLRGLVSCIIYIFESIIYLLMAGAVFFVIYGAFLMTASEEKRDAGKQIIYHGIIGLFVMISVWGLVNILDSTFNLSRVGPFAPTPLSR